MILVFTLISYSVIVFSFILISTDNWFPKVAQWLSVLFLFNSWVIWNDNKLELTRCTPCNDFCSLHDVRILFSLASCQQNFCATRRSNRIEVSQQEVRSNWNACLKHGQRNFFWKHKIACSNTLYTAWKRPSKQRQQAMWPYLSGSLWSLSFPLSVCYCHWNGFVVNMKAVAVYENK